jgi:hypothetical protein
LNGLVQLSGALAEARMVVFLRQWRSEALARVRAYSAVWMTDRPRVAHAIMRIVSGLIFRKTETFRQIWWGGCK